MANDFDPSIPEYWAAKMQRAYWIRNVFKFVTDTRFEKELTDGDTFHRQYDDSCDQELDVYTLSTDIAVDDANNTDESLTINKRFARARSFDKFNIKQVKPDVIAHIGTNDAVKLANQMDSDVLAEVANANYDVDDGDLGGTDGNSVAVTTSNIADLFATAGRKLDEANIEDADRFAIIDPATAQTINLALGNRDTSLGDRRVLDGDMGVEYEGFRLYKSNQIYGTAVLSLVTNPTNTDTVTINGTAFTFVSSIGTTAGNVLIAGTVDGTRANLEALINAPGTTTANGVGWSTTGASAKYTYRKLNNRATATNDDSADTLTVTYKGQSAIAVSETLTDATDTWTAALTTKNCLFGAGNPITMVTQIAPMVEVSPIPLQFGQYVKRGMQYGLKTFKDGAEKMINVKVKA